MGIMNNLRLKLNILIINLSQIPVISATGLVKKPQRVRESQFIINVCINILEAFTTIILLIHQTGTAQARCRIHIG